MVREGKNVKEIVSDFKPTNTSKSSNRRCSLEVAVGEPLGHCYCFGHPSKQGRHACHLPAETEAGSQDKGALLLSLTIGKENKS